MQVQRLLSEEASERTIRTHDDHAHEPGDEARNLGESLYDDERTCQIDQGRECVMRDDLATTKRGGQSLKPVSTARGYTVADLQRVRQLFGRLLGA